MIIYQTIILKYCYLALRKAWHTVSAIAKLSSPNTDFYLNI